MKKQYKTAIEAAVKYLERRDRTENEVRARLRELEFPEREIDEAIDELYSSLLINDEEYAHEFVKSKLAVRPVSRRALKAKLKSHKLSDEHIDAALSELDENSDYENAYSEAVSFVLAHMTDCTDRENEKKQRDRLMRRLISHGYDFDTVRRAIRNALEEVKPDSDDIPE